MGNRWNNKTLRLPRPKVCKSPLPPKIELRCVLKPPGGSIDEFEELKIEVLGWAQSLELSSDIEMEITAQKASIEGSVPPRNVNEFDGEFTLANPSGLGLDIVAVTLTFIDGSECTTIINVTWTEVGDP